MVNRGVQVVIFHLCQSKGNVYLAVVRRLNLETVAVKDLDIKGIRCGAVCPLFPCGIHGRLGLCVHIHNDLSEELRAGREDALRGSCVDNNPLPGTLRSRYVNIARPFKRRGIRADCAAAGADAVRVIVMAEGGFLQVLQGFLNRAGLVLEQSAADFAFVVLGSAGLGAGGGSLDLRRLVAGCRNSRLPDLSPRFVHDDAATLYGAGPVCDVAGFGAGGFLCGSRYELMRSRNDHIFVCQRQGSLRIRKFGAADIALPVLDIAV